MKQNEKALRNRLTAEEIVQQAEAGNRSVKASINKLYREQDESHLWPISGGFNATERAIRRVREVKRVNGGMSPLEYAYAIEGELSEIVNNNKNWSCNRVEFYEMKNL